MNPSDLSPRLLVAIGLLAVIPVLWYGFDRSFLAAGFATVNVLIIVTTLTLAFGPADSGEHHANGENAA